MNSTFFEYHVAISFAGENREIAEALANCLTQFDVLVFYDRSTAETSTLWGKNGHEHFYDVYENRALYCLIIFSEHYLDPNNEWTKIEFEAARKRQRREQEYILLLKVDDTNVPCGLPKTVLYFPWTGDTKLVCDTLLCKLPEYLIWTLKHGRSLDVIETAAELLGKNRERTAIEPLIQALLYRDKRIQKRVAEALVNMGEPTIEPLIQHLKDGGWEIPPMQKWLTMDSREDGRTCDKTAL